MDEYIQQAVSILQKLGKCDVAVEIRGQLVEAILQELGKDRRTAQINIEKESKKNAWRKDPATPGQLHELKRISVLHNANITKGEASDMIDFHKNEQFRR